MPRIVEGKKEERAIAVLDLLYLFREEPRTRNSLKAGLRPQAGGWMPAKRGKAGTIGQDFAERLDSLMAIFSDDRLDRLLLDYALSRHQKEMAVDLVRLVSETLPEFRDWLSSLARSRRRPDGAISQRPREEAAKIASPEATHPAGIQAEEKAGAIEGR